MRRIPRLSRLLFDEGSDYSQAFRESAAVATKIQPAGANAKGSHWCLQLGTANNEHCGLVGEIGHAASSPLIHSRRSRTTLTPLTDTLSTFHLWRLRHRAAALRAAYP